MLTALKDTIAHDGQGRQVIVISMEQMERHCADSVFELRTESNSTVTVMSDSAYEAFTEQQQQQIASLTGSILHMDLSCIETHGGRGVSEIVAELN